jgi:putative acetyltransferase
VSDSARERNEGVALRPMRPDDLSETLDLWVASWQAAYPAIDFQARRAWMADRLAEHRREGAACVLAVAAERIVGLLVLNARTGYLDQIVVGAEQQGTGIADLLLAEAARLAPAGFSLHVNQDNARAIRFYEKHGFKTVGEDVNPRSGAPIYRMRWEP